MRARYPSYAENRIAELTALDRPLTKDERADLAMYRKRAQWDAARRNRYASDPAYRQAEIRRKTEYWRENRA